MKKVRVDFVAHYSVVVAVNECDDMYEVAENLAQSYIDSNHSVKPTWEVEDGGIGDADVNDDVDVEQKEEVWK